MLTELFTNKQTVGSTVLSFLESNHLTSHPIIMVDNSHKSLNNAEAVLTTAGIDFKGLRYGRTDTRKNSFDPVLGIIELWALLYQDKILDDEEAAQIRKENPKVDYEECLDTWIQVYS